MDKILQVVLEKVYLLSTSPMDIDNYVCPVPMQNDGGVKI